MEGQNKDIIEYFVEKRDSDIPISVIIPLYFPNKGFFEKCLNALFGQTIQGIEYIFVDDSGTGESEKFIEKVLEQYPNRSDFVRYVANEKNIGCCSSRALGISFARGKYIAWCDQDDEMDLTMLEKMYNNAVNNDCDMVYCDINYIFTRGNCEDRMLIKRYYSNPTKRELLDFLTHCSSKGIGGTLWNRIVKRSIFYNHKIFYTPYQVFEDCLATYQLISFSNSFCYIQEPLYWHREHSQSVMHNSNGNFDKIMGKIKNAERNLCAMSWVTLNYDINYPISKNIGYLRLALLSSFSEDLSRTKTGNNFVKKYARSLIKDFLKNKDISLRMKISMFIKLMFRVNI